MKRTGRLTGQEHASAGSKNSNMSGNSDPTVPSNGHEASSPQFGLPLFVVEQTPQSFLLNEYLPNLNRLVPLPEGILSPRAGAASNRLYKDVYLPAYQQTFGRRGYALVDCRKNLNLKEDMAWLNKNESRCKSIEFMRRIIESTFGNNWATGACGPAPVELIIDNMLVNPFGSELYPNRQIFLERLEVERAEMDKEVERKKWVKRVSEDAEKLSFASLSPETKSRIDHIQVMMAKHRETLVKELKILINDLLIANPPDDYEEQRKVSQYINTLLKDNSFAIAHPETKQPCSVFVKHVPSRGQSWFVLTLRNPNVTDDQGKRLVYMVMSPAVRSLAELELVQITRPESSQFRRKD